MLSYRHAFHTGNHADVLKHFVLCELLDYYNGKDKPWWYLDTHAGAGCYALESAHSALHAEYENGIARLWERQDIPEPLASYMNAVRQFNPSGRLLFYPGSPAIAMTKARPQDALKLFEMHPADFRNLQDIFAREQKVVMRQHDGFSGLRGLLPPSPRRAVTLIDPSYEIKDDYRKTANCLKDALKRFPTGTYAIWYPMLRRIEAQRLPVWLAEQAGDNWLDVRLMVRSPPDDGMGLFGSGMFISNPPWTLPERLETVMPWLVKTLAEDHHAGFDLEHRIT